MPQPEKHTKVSKEEEKEKKTPMEGSFFCFSTASGLSIVLMEIIFHHVVCVPHPQNKTETGFDPLCRCGITAEWKETYPQKITWDVNFGEADKLVNQEENVEGGNYNQNNNNKSGGGGGKRRTVYVITGVPEDFPFDPVCRKEVSEIAWYPIDHIPKPSYAVLPFLHPLKKYIYKKKKMAHHHHHHHPAATAATSTSSTRKKTPSNRTGSRGRSSRGRPGSRGRHQNDSRGRAVVQKDDDDDLVASGLASAGDVSGWSEEDMFLTNERLIGRKIEYDGNPHVFAEEGLSQGDPHAFRVVGGSFLNSDGGVGSLAPPPDRSRLQPLFRKQNDEKNDPEDSEIDSTGLTPFFSDDGATPWGEVVVDAISDDNEAKPTKKSKQKKNKKNTQVLTSTVATTTVLNEMNEQSGLSFLTDRQITEKSQSDKARAVELFPCNSPWKDQYEKNMEYIREWVARLPQPAATKHFGLFRLDADAIMAQAERDVPALRPPV